MPSKRQKSTSSNKAAKETVKVNIQDTRKESSSNPNNKKLRLHLEVPNKITEQEQLQQEQLQQEQAEYTSSDEEERRLMNELKVKFKHSEDIKEIINLEENRVAPLVIQSSNSTVAKLESYTAFEIANFVTDHPNILELITIIKESKKVSAEHSKMTVYQAKVENKDNKLLIEELKLLFLKCRAPNSHIFNAIITSVYPELSNQLYKDEATKLRHACSLKMSDFRFKYLNKLTNMAKEYLKDNNSNTSVENFIGDSWRIILRMFLRAICKVEFEKSKADQENLRKFVLESFKIVLDYEKGEVEGLDIPGNTIKNTLDHLTLDIKVPSISKRNIVDSIDLKLLLK
ncbi:unnamed protein product [Rhizophagus irregularis]|nr:unnamed protein product [Rhizophagus irregularis]